ncbi:MAG: CvpA family protein [Rhodothermaceae bacterium]|nr:CvpA family protein [Rhodothermaceae bacterium]
MSWLDIVILLVLGVGLLVGARRGFVRQVFGLVGLLIAIALGYSFMEGVGGWLENRVGLPVEYSPLAGFGLVFLGAQLFFMIITRGVDRFIRNIVFIGTINRILGGAFGVVTACLALSLVLYVLASVGLPPSEVRGDSALYEVVYQFFPQTWSLATAQFPELAEVSERFNTGL